MEWIRSRKRNFLANDTQNKHVWSEAKQSTSTFAFVRSLFRYMTSIRPGRLNLILVREIQIWHFFEDLKIENRVPYPKTIIFCIFSMKDPTGEVWRGKPSLKIDSAS